MKMPGPAVTLGVLAVALAGWCARGAAASAPAGAPTWSVFAPGPRATIPGPDQIAVSPDGTIYALNGAKRTIERISPSGKVLAHWGPSADIKYSEYWHNTIAVGPDGTVYVASDPNVLVYSSSGRLKAKWNLGSVVAVAVPRSGTVYVFREKSGPQILELKPAGTLLKTIPTPPAEKVQETPTPLGLAVAPDGTIYDIVQSSTGEGKSTSPIEFLQKRSATGKLLTETTQVGEADLAVASGGTLFSLSEAPQEFMRWDAKLNPHKVPASAACDFNVYGGLAADATGNVYASDPGNQNIHKVSAAGKNLAILGSCPDDSLNGVIRVAVAASGTVYADARDILAYSPGGTKTGHWSVPDVAPDLKVDTAGNVYVAVAYKRFDVYEYSPAGRLIRKIPVNAWPYTAEDSAYIALDSHDSLYAYDGVTHTVYQLTPKRRVVANLSGKDEYSQPNTHGIAVDRAGNAYVTERNSQGNINGVLKLSPKGKKLAAIHADDPWGIALDRAGNIYATGYGNDTVQEYSPLGKRIAVWSKSGSGPGQFHEPEGIAVDTHGNVYVADTLNNRIQKLTVSG